MRHGSKQVCPVSVQQQQQALRWLAYQQYISQVELAFKPGKIQTSLRPWLHSEQKQVTTKVAFKEDIKIVQ